MAKTVTFYTTHYDWAEKENEWDDSYPVELDTESRVLECPGEFVKWCDVGMHREFGHAYGEIRMWETPARQAANAIRAEYLSFSATGSDWAADAGDHAENLYGTDWWEKSAHLDGFTDAERNAIVRMVEYAPPFCTTCRRFHYGTH